MADFGSARKWARALIEANVGAGARIVDGTMGNGYDTEWLAGLAGKDGHVFGFDIQPEAVERTRTRLEAAGLLERATLICDGHQKLAEYVKEPLDAAVFNLGWLPGGDKRITTHWETTRAAISAALSLLMKGGVCTICAYPGHAAGDEERAALMAYLSALRPQEYNVLHHRFLNAGAGAPECFVVQRQ